MAKIKDYKEDINREITREILEVEEFIKSKENKKKLNNE